MKNYKEIAGWFNHQETYDFLLAKVPEGGTFVELGAWLGKSSAYLCDKATHQNITIIDSWKGSPNELTTTHQLATEVDIYDLFVENMGERKYKAIRATSKASMLRAPATRLKHLGKGISRKKKIPLWIGICRAAFLVVGAHLFSQEARLKSKARQRFRMSPPPASHQAYPIMPK